MVTVATELRELTSVTEEFVYSWVRWREACEDVHSAYQRWLTCEPKQSDFAFEVYLAALDREEHAARLHCRQSRMAGQAQ